MCKIMFVCARLTNCWLSIIDHYSLQWTKYIIVSKYANGRDEQVDTFDTTNVKNYPRSDLSFRKIC